ncbi:GNAT family N-acetyltransferase [Marivita sp. S0852]|uniref:GNAT family N-acetyltransferase n=1 Tax=Marivita sp. S0852 TaxID=3373893 RepID=UPI003981C612
MTPATFARIMDRAYVDMRPWSDADIAQTCASPHVTLIARPNGAVLVQVLAGDAEILAFAVDPDAQRSGIATALLSDALNLAARSGCDRIFLEVATSNDAARAFYAARGFAQVGLRKAYYTLRDGTKDDALLLSRPVA